MVPGYNYCFYPSGDFAHGDNSYFPSMDVSPCPFECEDWTNGLCFDKKTEMLSRGSCTDRSWGSPCPQCCTESSYGVDWAIPLLLYAMEMPIGTVLVNT